MAATTVFDNSATFLYTGSTQVWKKPINVYSIYCRVNGGGGGGSAIASGGGGAYVFTKYNFLDKDVSYNVFVNIGSGGKTPPTKTGGRSLGGKGVEVNGGDGTTLETLSSGGGGGMSSLFYQDGSGNNTIRIIAGGGGGGGGNVGNGGGGSRTGVNGLGSGGGQGGNQNGISGLGGLGGVGGGVNGFNYIDSSNTTLNDISNNGIYSFNGGGGGNGGTFAGGGGGAGYGGGAGGKGGGGGGGGSISNGNTVYYVPGAGGAGGSINNSGEDGSIIIGWFEEIPVVPPPIVGMFMMNPQHTSRSTYYAPSTLPLSENVTIMTTDSLIYPYPYSITIDKDEEIYFISGDGYLYKYDHKMNFIWRYKISNYDFIGTPAISSDGTIYVCSTTNTGLYTPYLYAIIEEITGIENNAQGSIKWSVSLDGNCVGSPMLDASGNIYVGTTNGSVYKVVDNLVRGIDVWKTPTTALGYPITGTLAIDTDYKIMIYTAENSIANTSYMYSVDISNNITAPVPLWTKTIANDTYNSPSIRGNSVVYATTQKGKVYGYNNLSGNDIWGSPSIDVYDGSLSNIAIGNDAYIYFTSKNGLNVINSSTGQREWKYTIEISNNNLSNSVPIIDASNNVYFGTNSHYLYSVNGVSRTHLWKYKVGGPIQSSPVIGNKNNIKLLANDGKLYDISGNGNPVVPTNPEVQMFMINERHTGKSPYSAPATQPTIKWTSNFVSGNLYILPTIALSSNGTRLYLGSNDGYLYSLNTSTGAEIWKTKVSNPDYSLPVSSHASLYTSPAISTDGTIYVGSNDGYLHAINSGGTKKWSYNAGYPLQSSPMIDSSGAIYFGAGTKMFSIGDGDTSYYAKWLAPFDTSGNINSSPALGQNGTLYFGSDDGKVYGINRKTGEYVWAYDANITSPAGINPIYTSPSVDSSNNVIIGNGSYMNGELYYLDGSNNDGSKIWSNTYDINIGPFYNTVAINDANNTFYLSTIAYVYAIDRTSVSGAEKWKFRKANCYYTSPVIDANGKILFCSLNARTSYGYLHMITDNGNTYTEDWMIELSTSDKGRLSPPVIGSDGTIYISSTANKIYAVNI